MAPEPHLNGQLKMMFVWVTTSKIITVLWPLSLISVLGRSYTMTCEDYNALLDL